MSPRPALFFTIYLKLALILLVFFAANTASSSPGNALPILLGNLTISGSNISDQNGNFVGVTIPLKRAGRLLMIEGTIDNITGNFILDTGASGLVLNKTYFRNFLTFDDEEGGGVTGATEAVSRARVKKLVVSDLVYTNISADVTPLGHLENRRGVKILGLFGMNLLKNLEIVIDVRSNELQLFKLDRNGNRLVNPSTSVKYDIVQKIDSYRNVVFVKATMGGKLLDFCLDSGAESNVLSTNAPKNALSKVNITRRSSLQGVGEAQGEVLYGTMTDFVMGNRPLHPMETIVCSLDAMAQKYGYPIDGMLGYDFFAKGRIYINLVKKEMGICLRQGEKL